MLVDRKQVPDALNNLGGRAACIGVAVAQTRGNVARKPTQQGELFVVAQLPVREQTMNHRRRILVRFGQLGQRLGSLCRHPVLLLAHRAMTTESLASHGANRVTSSRVKYLIGPVSGG